MILHQEYGYQDGTSQTRQPVKYLLQSTSSPMSNTWSKSGNEPNFRRMGEGVHAASNTQSKCSPQTWGKEDIEHVYLACMVKEDLGSNNFLLLWIPLKLPCGEGDVNLFAANDQKWHKMARYAKEDLLLGPPPCCFKET